MARRILGARATIAASGALLIASGLVACGSDTDTDTDDAAPQGAYGAPATEQAGETAAGTEDEQTTEAADATEVRVSGFEFTPSSVTVSVGDTVTWVFDDGQIPHNVVSRDAAPEEFRSPTIREDSWSFTFSEPGEYNYFCSIHPQMTGTVIVEE